MMAVILLQFLLLGVLIFNAESCKLHGFIDMGLMERFVQSEYVIYGQTIGHVPRKVTTKDNSYYAIDGVFDVYCIFKKGNEVVNSQITILNLSPREQCSGTPVTKLMRVGDQVILAVKSEGGGRFSLDEILPLTTAVVRASKPFFFSFARVCYLQMWESPMGANRDRCPVCGTADFDPEVKAFNNSNGEMSACLSTGSYTVGDMTSACDLYMEYSMEEANQQTCVPTGFTGACVLLDHRTTKASCDCSNKKIPKLNVGAGEMVLPNVMLIMALLSLNF